MKKIILAAVAIAVVATGAIFVVAQKRANVGGGHGFGHGRGDRIGMFLRGLDLTDEQKTKVKEIMETNNTAFARQSDAGVSNI